MSVRDRPPPARGPLVVQRIAILLPLAVIAATYHVDPTAGDDAAAGSAAAPWRSIGRALPQLQAGDTLLLATGRYHEQVRCSLVGQPDRPIVIAGAPGAAAVVDGSWREFHESPQSAWEVADGELYRSAQRYGNTAEVAGSFAADGTGLHTYWLHRDLVADNELAAVPVKGQPDLSSVYCGPGIWLDRDSGYLYGRFSHTHNRSPLVRDYDGPTDPRQLPLVIGPASSVPLRLAGARHVQIRNLTITGGGFDTVLIDDCDDLLLSDLRIRSGSLRGQYSGRIVVQHCEIAGRTPPWCWRSDSSTGCASGTLRDYVRVLTPILFDTCHQRGGYSLPRQRLVERLQFGESADATAAATAMPQMTQPPSNHGWQVSWCEIRNGHDGVFFSGQDMAMDHCAIDNMQDDALDFSSPVPGLTQNVRFEDSLIRRCVTALSTHNQGRGQGAVSIRRNIIDLRAPVAWARPTPARPEGGSHPGNGFFMHGADHADDVESYVMTNNTFIGHVYSRYFYAFGTLNHLKPGASRRVAGNLFVYLDAYPRPYVSRSLADLDLQAADNEHWSLVDGQAAPRDFLTAWQEHEFTLAAETRGGQRWEVRSRVADPGLRALAADPSATNDYRPQGPHAAGALAWDAAVPAVGRHGRITPGSPLSADPPLVSER